MHYQLRQWPLAAGVAAAAATATAAASVGAEAASEDGGFHDLTADDGDADADVFCDAVAAAVDDEYVQAAGHVQRLSIQACTWFR